MSIHLQISSCNYPPSRQPLCLDLVSFQHPYSRPPFNPSSAIPPHPRSNFHPRLHRPFFPPPPPLSTPVSADFSFPHLSTHCHFGYIIDRASLRILPLLSRAFLKITSQTYPFHFIFTYRSFHFQRVGNISILERRDFSRLDNFYKAR